MESGVRRPEDGALLCCVALRTFLSSPRNSFFFSKIWSLIMPPHGVSVTRTRDNAYIIYLTFYLATKHLLGAYFVLLIMIFGIKKNVPLVA